MRVWKIVRISTFDDKELADKLTEIDSVPGQKVEEVIYMGDDIPDLQIMQIVGCPCCPADACQEVKDMSVYISHKNGGYGCVRDVIEQVLKAQGLWMADARAFGW